VLLLSTVAIILPTFAAQAAKFKDSRGTDVQINLGDEAFADRNVIADNPSKLRAGIADPSNALSVPNYKAVKDNGTYYSLGCKGSAVWEFTDNTLTDVEGDDLYLFEVGPDIEPTTVEISGNGVNWVSLGVLEGGKASVDISSVSSPGDVFRFVRLTDLGKACKSRSPGADIDAIAAVGGGKTLSLDSAVLFEVGSFVLKPSALNELATVMGEVRSFEKFRVHVTGHTDSDGSDAYNQQLSQQRAQSVVNYMTSTVGISGNVVSAFGRGENSPIASNVTPEGKAKNRRVEITVIPTE
jgi:outer membrane protein OmpA-like peptidoglycan-associated protein